MWLNKKIKMRKNIFFITIALTLVTYSATFCQNIKFGIVAGLNISKSNLTNIPNGYNNTYNPMMTYNFNAFVSYKNSKSWGLSLEPGFIQKGEKQDGLETNYRYNLNYIHMPILFIYDINDKMYFSIGPELGYLINTKLKSKETTIDLTSSYSNRFELSGLAGINYKVSDHLDVGLRYNHGISYQSQIEWTDIQGNNIGKSNIYNQYFQLVLKYKI